MISATAHLSNGYTSSDYGASISQRLLKANNEYEPPKKKQYNLVKKLNDKMWGYYEEFGDYVHIGDGMNLRGIIKECPLFVTYFENYDNRLHSMIRQFNVFIEHARLGEWREILTILDDHPEFIDTIHSFVGNVDIKKQCQTIAYFANKRDSKNLMTLVRGHAEIMTTVTGRYEEIRASSNRQERVVQFNDLLMNIKEGHNAVIRSLRRADPDLTRDIADIIECDRLVNFNDMLTCAAEGNAIYMKYLIEQYPYLVNYISDQVPFHLISFHFFTFIVLIPPTK